MSLSTPRPKFLLDENVRADLAKYLESQGLDVKLALKASPDSYLATLSKTEKRILVTNDDDFADYSNDNIFSVILLKIPQNDPESLIVSFTKLLKEFNKFTGRLVILETGKWNELSLPRDISYKT